MLNKKTCILFYAMSSGICSVVAMENTTVATAAGEKLVSLCRTAHLSHTPLTGATGTWVIKSHLSNNPDLSVCDRQGSALMWLSFFGHKHLYDLLLQKGADIGVVSEMKYNALHAAAQEGHLDIVHDIILQKRLPIDAQAACGSTALHLATQAGELEIVLFLLEHGACSEIRDSLERTPLHLAAWNNEGEICRSLLLRGAKPNAPMKGGYTPLHLATMRKSMGALQLLIMHGGDETVVPESGQKLVDLLPEPKLRMQFLSCLRFFVDQRTTNLDQQQCKKSLN